MMAVTVIGGTGLASLAQEADVSSWVPKWTQGVTLRTGAGYRDNITLAHFSPEARPFFLSGLDFVATRLPIDGPQVDLLVTAEDRRYLGPASVDGESTALAQADVTKYWSAQWRTSFGLEYLYQDQILDVSASETILRTVAARGHTLTARPAVRWDLTGQNWLELGVPIERQLFQEPLDDYWAAGSKLSAVHAYGRSSEVSLSYELSRAISDDAPQLTADGIPVPGTHRAYLRHDLQAAWRHYYDEAQHWRTTTKLGFRLNRDDGSGYFDYNRWQASEQLRYRSKTWEASAEVRFADYEYGVQTVSPTNPAKRERQELAVNLRLEKKLARFLRLFAEYEREQTFSNLALDEYTVNTVSGGLQWEF